jgi:hypothetical protein
LKKKLSDLQLEFSKNVNEENSKFPFKQEELGKLFCLCSFFHLNLHCFQLDGVPTDVINSLEKVNRINLNIFSIIIMNRLKAMNT